MSFVYQRMQQTNRSDFVRVGGDSLRYFSKYMYIIFETLAVYIYDVSNILFTDRNIDYSIIIILIYFISIKY